MAMTCMQIQAMQSSTDARVCKQFVGLCDKVCCTRLVGNSAAVCTVVRLSSVVLEVAAELANTCEQQCAHMSSATLNDLQIW
jgi:hypothetical protein